MRTKSSLILALAAGLGCSDVLLPPETGDYPAVPDRAGFGELFDKIKVEFGEVECGKAGAEQVVLITNRRDHAIYWDGQLGKTDDSPFTLSEDNGSIAPHQSVRLVIRPRPIAPSAVTEGNAYGDVLRVKTNEPGLEGPFEIPLVQTARGGVLRFAVPEVDLGKALAPVARPVELRNVGNAPVTVTLDVPAPFTGSVQEVEVPAGGAVPIEARYAPGDRFGIFERQLRVKVKGGTLCGSLPETKLTVSRSDKLVEMCGGEGYTCALGETGHVFCWGSNYYGQLGNGTSQDARLFTQVEALNDATHVTCGYQHACAIRRDKTAVCWGGNGEKKQFEAQSLYGPGQLGNGTKIDSKVPVPVQGLTNVLDIQGGANFTCAIVGQNGGKVVYCWGGNVDGELGNGASPLPQPPAAPAAPSLVPVPVTGLGTTVERMAVSRAHTCVVKADKTMWCWGENDGSELGNGQAAESVSTPVQVDGITDALTPVTAGYHSCVLRQNGKVFCFGINTYGRLGLGDEIPPGTYAADVASSSVDTPVAANAKAVVDLDGPLEIFGGSGHTCALRADKVPVCWGRNNQGMLGHGLFGNGKHDEEHGDRVGPNSRPLPVKGLTNVKHIFVAYNHTCALTETGEAWCWGSDVSSELGDGKIDDSPVPVRVVGF